MLDKIPPPVIDWIAPLWVWLLGLLGGATAYLESFRIEDGWRVWLLKAASKGTSAGLAAVLTYHALQGMNITGSWQVFLVGISGHMGVESLKFLSDIYRSKVGK